MQMTSTMCRHQPVAIAGLEVIACPSCRTVEWKGRSRVLDPAEGMAVLFGEYRLVGRLPAIRAPGREVLMYAAPGRPTRRHLDAFPVHVWVQVDDLLWMSHDGVHLLLSPTSRIFLDNLTREERTSR